jgi:enoyl-CoA hydratase/carnithine racemase
MSEGRVTLTVEGALAWITLDRPAKHNAMTPAMAGELAQAATAINADRAVRVAILRGGGDRAFCAGSDLDALAEYDGVWDFRNRVEYATEVRRIRKPVVAAIKGWALGGGLEMALSCDLRVAGAGAQLGAPEVQRGWVGAGGGSQLLPRLVGYGRAAWMLLSGTPIDAQQAEAWGVVERVVPDEALWDEVRAVAEGLAQHSEVALVTVKAALRASLSTSLEQGLAYENEVMALAFALGNDAAGRAAFATRKGGRP